MGLTVKDRGEIIATFRYIQVSLMETLAAWVPSTPEMEVKLLFGAHLWDVAQHADALGKRTFELRLPLQHSLRPSDATIEMLAEMSEVEETGLRVAGFYDVMLPTLEAHYRQYLEQSDSLMDAPTVRILERMLEDESRMIRESRELRQQVTNVQVTERTWLESLTEKASTIDNFALHQPDELAKEAG